MQKNSGIGGQAVLEGIMMRNRDTYSVAVRKPDGTIEMKTEPYNGIGPAKAVAKIPVVRGVFAFIDSLVLGMSSLMWSAEYAVDEEEDEKEEKKATSSKQAEKSGEGEGEKKDSWGAAMTITLIVSIAFSIGLFIVLPYFLAGILRRFGVSEILVSLAEALLRIVIFLAYMLLISRMEDIQRVFAYHGAEHKCINCIESGLELNVDNVMVSSRQHKRCGTSFLLYVIAISVVAFLILGMLGITSPLLRFLSRIILVPVIAGISFEVLRLAGSSDNICVTWLAKPGLALQKLVTREPSPDMCEVAIAAVNAVFDWKKWQEENL